MRQIFIWSKPVRTRRVAISLRVSDSKCNLFGLLYSPLLFVTAQIYCAAIVSWKGFTESEEVLLVLVCTFIIKIHKSLYPVTEGVEALFPIPQDRCPAGLPVVLFLGINE